MALPLIPAIGALLAGIFIRKLVVGFGFAAVTYVGFDIFFDRLKQYFYDGYYSLPLDLAILLDIGGFKHGTKRYEFFRCEESLNAAAFTSVVGSQYRPPKEAFKYYKSASQHIKFKKKLHPVFIMIPIGIVFMFYLGVPLFSKWFGLSDNQSQKQKSEQQHAKIEEQDVLNVVQPPTLPQQSKFQEAAASVPEFSEAYYRPRVEGMPETAPIYDGIRSVNRMESVAACIKGRKGCDCYTDFGTKVSIKPETCRDWAENGLPFNPYRREGVGMAEGQNARISQPDANKGEGGVYVMGGKDKLTLLPDYSKGPSAQ